MCTAHLDELLGYIENVGFMALNRQRASNDFASNMSTLVISTAFGLLKQDTAWNNKQQFKDLSKYVRQFPCPLPCNMYTPQLRLYPVNYYPPWVLVLNYFK